MAGLVRRLTPQVIAIATFLVLAPAYTVRAQGVYSYLDASGIRTLTNIPPKESVRDLRLSPSAVVAPASPVASPAPSPTETSSRASRYDPLIERHSLDHQIDPALIRAMIVQESNYNERAVSRKGARGLMQLMPETAARLGVSDIFDPDENIRGGVRHMRSLLDMFNDDLTLTLAAYNAGETLVQRIRRVPNFPETRQYVRNISARYGKVRHTSPQRPTLESTARLYRFVDPQGVVHLTNLPPVERAAAR